jgi:hypothetical protein
MTNPEQFDDVEPVVIDDEFTPGVEELVDVEPVEQVEQVEELVESAVGVEIELPTGHDLGVIIPSDKGRRIAYAVYTAASLIVTNVAVAFTASGTEVPTWVIVSLAVVGNLATPFGALAIANAKGKES